MAEHLLEVENLKMYFKKVNGVFRRKTSYVKAVDNISFTIDKKETFGLVGESGCGKTTTGRALIRLYEPTGGTIRYDGEDITKLSAKEFMPYRKKMQMIFQDPYASLNARMTVSDIIGEPLDIHHLKTGKEREEFILELLDRVGLNKDHASRYPHEFSGGQRQRVGIARALAVDPEFIICDEPISALDVSIQAQVVNMLKDLQEEFGLTYLFVAHDLSMVRHISDRVGVMYLGSLVEVAETEELYRNNLHPYSKALLSAIPIADPEKAAQNKQILLEGEVPSPLNSPVGCKFASRCPYAKPECREAPPPLRDVGGNHYVACYLVYREYEVLIVNIEQTRAVLEKFPRLELGAFPTPLQPMKNLQRKLNTPVSLYIKRDDLTGLGPGGNKTRNLEYLLGEAVEQGCDVIFASGKSQSNLCTLTVSACCKADLDCVIVHNDASEPEHKVGNQLLNKLSGAELRYVGDIVDKEREALVLRYAKELEEQGRHPYVVKNGASTALGSLGYVHAVMELCGQCREQKLDLKHLFVPGGNGGLAAGTIFGAALSQAPFHVHVITVEHEKEELQEILETFLREIGELTGVLQDYDFSSVYTIHEEYRGDGWGKATPECVQQIYELAQTEGIYVEQVYTSKTLYGMLDMVRKGQVDGSACYLHTGGFSALFSQF